jgi:molybdopterin/thiamine biosynthesis adenylyltransferase
MNKDANTENARTLAAALGIGEEKALALLSVTVAVTFDTGDATSSLFAGHVFRMVSRTIERVVLNGQGDTQNIAVELVIGSAKSRFATAHLFASIGANEVLIGQAPLPQTAPSIHPVGILLGACFAVGAILKKAFNELLPFPAPQTLRINMAELLGDDLPLLDKPVFFDEAYLAGAGAIGNGFVYGLSNFKASGLLHVVDDDGVSNGNLQRCVYFLDKHVGLPKSDVLCEAIANALPEIKTVSHKMRLQDVPAKKAGAWLKRLIVGVDSPRARRKLQSEFPQEVFDASTTGITEVVLHFNWQPTELACMGCIYYESPEEHAHENHVAETLGVSIGDVKQERISAEIAKTIHLRNPHIPVSELEGLAYDTLFKRLCSTGKLMTAEGRQVLAPFAFVSVLAGTLLAIEFVRRIHNRTGVLFNEWHVSPWTNPVLRCRHVLRSNPDCELCGNEVIARAARRLWQPA